MNSLTKALGQLDIRLGSNPSSAKKSTAFEENDLITMVGGKKVGSSGYFVRYSGKGLHRRAVIHLEGVGKCTSSLAYIEKQVWKNDIWKKNEIPDVEPQNMRMNNITHTDLAGRKLIQRFAHNMLVIPSNDGTNDHRLVILGGYIFADGEDIGDTSSIQCLQLRGGKPNARWSFLPNMHDYRCTFGAACVEEKVYAIGGIDGDGPYDEFEDTATFEFLDLNDMQRGWVIREIPVRGQGYQFHSCKAAAVDNRHIYVVCAKQDGPKKFMSLISYDTQAGNWNTELPKPFISQDDNTIYGKNENTIYGNYGITSIVIPGEGTYVVVVTGKGVQKTAQAYHVESNKWIRLPNLPHEVHVESSGLGLACKSVAPCPVVTTIGNRYILVAGSTSVAALDWKQRKWIVLPSKPEVGNDAAGAFVGGSVNKLYITGGYNSRGDDFVGPSSLSLEIASGIGWAKEKLLLLCFQKKAQKGNKVKVKGPCLLEDLDSGIFANILTYLFVPFQKEIECKGSIFADMLGLPLGKRSCDSSTTSQATKKSRNAL